MSPGTLVMGATGAVGGQLLALLRSAGERAVGASRNPGRAAAARGGEWRGLDLERPETFPGALRGMERVFVVARPGDEHPEEAAAPLIEAARAAGVQRVVSLTAMGVEQDPEFGLRRMERLVEAAGLEYTHLRPNFFMQVFAAGPLAAAIRGTGTLRLPAAHARLSYVHTADVAAAAFGVLTARGHAGRAYTLTGPEALDHDQVAEHMAGASGRAIVYEPLTEAEARAELAATGLGEARVERLLGFYRRVRAGHCAPVSAAVEEITGRPPHRFAAFAAEYASCWRGR